jgi:hypothetical protein
MLDLVVRFFLIPYSPTAFLVSLFTAVSYDIRDQHAGQAPRKEAVLLGIDVADCGLREPAYHSM